MNLLTVVIDSDDFLNEILTGWLELGISGATVIETTGSLQLISDHVPIFAGFRSLTSGGKHHNKTVFAVIKDEKLLENAISFIEKTSKKTKKFQQGIYFVTPVIRFGKLGKLSK
ncbi:MAG: hypothetical protein K9L30_03445 [Desulfobacterales bacterium]|nr:hypothetical protein [Desulfobacterales bacterium]